MFDFLDIDVVEYANHLIAFKIALMFINSYLIKDLYLIGLYIVCQIMWWYQYFDKNLTNFMTGTIQYEIILALVLAIIFYVATMMYECLLLLLIIILSYILYEIYNNPELVKFKNTTKEGHLLEYLPGSWICFSYIGAIITYYLHKNKNDQEWIYQTWVTLFLGCLLTTSLWIYYEQKKIIINIYLMVEEESQSFALWNLIPLIVIITLIAVLIFMQLRQKKPDAILYEQLNSQIDDQRISSHHLDTGDAMVIINEVEDTHRQHEQRQQHERLESAPDPRLSDLQMPVSSNQFRKPYVQPVFHNSFRELSQKDLDQIEVDAVYVVENPGQKDSESPLKQIIGVIETIEAYPINPQQVEIVDEDYISIESLGPIISDKLQSPDSFLEDQSPICNFCAQHILFSSTYLACHHQYHEECLQKLVASQLNNKSYQLTCMCNQKINSNIIRELEITQFNQLCQNQLQMIIQGSKSYLKFRRCPNVFCEFFVVDEDREPFICQLCD